MITSNYREFLFNAGFQQLFNLELRKFNKSNTRILNLTNRMHRQKFEEKLEEYITLTNLEEKVIRTCCNIVTPTELNAMDKETAFVLSVVRKCTEEH